MEDVLDVYEMPYNSAYPVICMDEKPYQLLGDARQPLPMRPGDDMTADYEYVREGTCSIFAFTEPLGGVRHVSVREQRTAIDWAQEIRYLADVQYPDAVGVSTLRCSNIIEVPRLTRNLAYKSRLRVKARNDECSLTTQLSHSRCC